MRHFVCSLRTPIQQSRALIGRNRAESILLWNGSRPTPSGKAQTILPNGFGRTHLSAPNVLLPASEEEQEPPRILLLLQSKEGSEAAPPNQP